MDPLIARIAARYKGKKTLDTGTVVYQYSEQQVARRNADKARRLEKLRGNIDKLRAQVAKDLQSKTPEKFLTALVIALIDETYERVGNDESADNGHFGVTGWQKDHVKFSRGKATISYIGKSGVKQKKTVKDPKLVRALRDAYEGCEEDCLFTHATGKIDAGKVNKYLERFDITAKDLRGFHANDVMKANLKAERKGKLPEAKKKREKQLKDEFKAALEATAKAVGHEASTLRSQYLVPGLEDSYTKDGTIPEKMTKEASDRMSIRVAERFRASANEVLTKEWLMGIRRGWLALMKPSISDYNDVIKAHAQLDAFVERLRDQVKFVRRGVYTNPDQGKLWAKLDSMIEGLLKAISDSKSRAQYWKDYIDGTAHSLQWGEDRTEDALKMLDLYKRDFAEATGTSVKMRGQRWKAVNLTYLMDPILKQLRKDAQRLTEWGLTRMPDPVYKEFDLNGMKVVIDDQNLTAKEVQAYIKLFDHAHALLRKKGFGKVWYGTLFVRCDSCGGPIPGGWGNAGGMYFSGPNVVHVYNRPVKGVEGLVIHELGHRWWFKHMKREGRLKFAEWVSSGLSPVSAYGGRNPEEAFAEAFLYFVEGRNMTSQQVETFKLVTFGGRFKEAAYDELTLTRVMAGLGMLMAQSVIVTNKMFSEAEVRRYIKLRMSYHTEFTDALNDLADAIDEGKFGSGPKMAAQPLRRIAAIPARQASRALRHTARVFRGLKHLKRSPEMGMDPRIMRMIYISVRLDPTYTEEYRHPSREYEILLRDLLRVKEIPAPVRTLLRKALKYASLVPTDTANAGAWFEMSPEVQDRLKERYEALEAEGTAAYEKYSDPEERSAVWKEVVRKQRRLLDAAGVNKEILLKGHQEQTVSLDKILQRESKLIADGPTKYVQTQLTSRIRDAIPFDYKGRGLPRPLGKVVTQLNKATTFDTMRRIVNEAIEAHTLTEEWASTLENMLDKVGKNLAVQKGGTLTPIQWKPTSVEDFQAKHGAGRVRFSEDVPEKQRPEILGQVSRALEDLEGIFGQGFAGKHAKPLDFEFEEGGMAAASYFGWDNRNSWQPRVRFGESFDGLLAHELSHYFDDLLATKLEEQARPGEQVLLGAQDLFGATGVDLEYVTSNERWMERLEKGIPELAEFARAVVNTPDFQRWKDMTSSAHEIGLEKAIKKLTGMSSYDLPKDHPYYRFKFDPPRFRSEWPPELLEATEHAYAQGIMNGDDRKLRYYHSGVEVWARMVEQYVYTRLADAGVANPWLTQLTYDTEELPQAMNQDVFEEKIAPILDRLFSKIRDRKILGSEMGLKIAERYFEALLAKKEWPLSAEVYAQLRKHFQSTNREGLPQESVDLLVDCLERGEHSDVLRAPPQQTLYRGMKVMTREVLAQLLGTEDFDEAGGALNFDDLVIPCENGQSTSWSASKKYTKDFSEAGKRGWGVTLFADPGDNPNRFLAGPGGLYDAGLSRWHLEKESVGLEPIKVRRIEWRQLGKS